MWFAQKTFCATLKALHHPPSSGCESAVNRSTDNPDLRGRRGGDICLAVARHMSRFLATSPVRNIRALPGPQPRPRRWVAAHEPSQKEANVAKRKKDATRETTERAELPYSITGRLVFCHDEQGADFLQRLGCTTKLRPRCRAQEFAAAVEKMYKRACSYLVHPEFRNWACSAYTKSPNLSLLSIEPFPVFRTLAEWHPVIVEDAKGNRGVLWHLIHDATDFEKVEPITGQRLEDWNATHPDGPRPQGFLEQWTEAVEREGSLDAAKMDGMDAAQLEHYIRQVRGGDSSLIDNDPNAESTEAPDDVEAETPES